MILILLLGLVVAFTMLAPEMYRRRGGPGLWLLAAGTGFSLLVLLIRRSQSGPGVETSWSDVVPGVMVWIVGATVGGIPAAGVGLLLLSGMAP